jgi:TPR repeat protein
MAASGIYHLASPHSQVHNSLASGADDPRAASGINVVGERAYDVVAQWNLGRMYAAGDGVEHDDLRAFEVFRGIADAHAEEVPGTPQARFVANASVALGNYYLEGIPDTEVKPDIERARNVYTYAASYFGDRDAQYRLGRMYLDGNGGPQEPKQAARWLSLAAGNGQYEAQALLGELLLNGEHLPRRTARGLMYLILACDGAPRGESWIRDRCELALKQATAEERVAALVDLERWLNGQPLKP